jgi:hypothetical protein
MSHICDDGTSTSCMVKIKRREEQKDKNAAAPALPAFPAEGR